ncbi:MAG: patatin-like protein [Actinobacteria bacterium]|nr:patatin-like protein [Actinomycetota bacterium]
MALAMRGGVSLAVWIGGACAEINALRLSVSGETNAAGTKTVGMYRKLLRAAGYSSVTIDVISGASAGGLNGALLSTTLMYGVDFDAMKTVWLSVADIEGLMRKPSESEPDSILMGDEYFLRRLNETLAAMTQATQLQSPPSEKEEKRLDLWLATTLVQGSDVLVYDDWATRYVEKSQSAVFHFRCGPYGTDFSGTSTDKEKRIATAYRLALAARSSSSFPGAFEPATICVERPKLLGNRPGADNPTNMFAIFSDALRSKQYVMDGGVLDNIPVGRAIGSIAAASADGPTERWLLFLHPSPEVTSGSPPGKGIGAELGSRPNALRTTLASFQTAAGRESLLDDISILRQHNDSALRNRSLRSALLNRLVKISTEELIREAGRRYPEYVWLRARAAAARIRYLLEDPVGALGEDPFTDNAFRTPLGNLGSMNEWSQANTFRLQDCIASALEDPPAWPGEGPTPNVDEIRKLGVPALKRAIDMLIGFLRSMQAQEASGPISSDLIKAKCELYSVRVVVELLHHMSDLFWPVYACLVSPQATKDWAEAALRARDEFLRSYWDESQEGQLGKLPEELRKTFRYLRQELKKVLGESGGDRDLVKRLWIQLIGCVERISSLMKRLEPPATEATPPEVAEELTDSDASRNVEDEARLLRRVLAKIADASPDEKRREAVVRFLSASEILSFPLDMMAVTGRQYIHFLRIAGTNETPLGWFFPGRKLTVRDKLAGNELNNFSAFYKTSWRANDWMWGRVDAATSLIDLLIRPSAIRKHISGNGRDAKEAFIVMLKECVTAPLDPSLELTADQQRSWQAHFDKLWRDSLEEITIEADALFEASDPETVELTNTKRVLTTRRHWELLVVELKDVVQAAMTQDLSEGNFEEPITDQAGSPDPTAGFEEGSTGGSPGWSKRMLRAVRKCVEGDKERQKREPLARSFMAIRAMGLDPLREPEAMKRLLGEYAVGRETIRDEVGKDRFTKVTADLTVVAWNAFPGRLRIGLLKPIGGLLRLLRLLALTIVRSRKWWLALTLTIIALSAYVAVENKEWLSIGRFGATVILLAATALLFYGASRPGRLLIAVLLLGVGMMLATVLSRAGPWTFDLTGWQAIILLVAVLGLWWAASAVQDRRDKERLKAKGNEVTQR